MYVDSTEYYIKCADKGTAVNYMLADLSVIPVVPDLKAVPPMNVQIILDDDFTSKCIKSKGALSESDTFTFECKNNNGEITLGYSSINTNRISMKVDCKCDGDVSHISFSAQYLKEILNANRGSRSANIKISAQGVAPDELAKDNLKYTY